jgi:DNA-directed RNA polymerase subunit RPC12/RpoP
MPKFDDLFDTTPVVTVCPDCGRSVIIKIDAPIKNERKFYADCKCGKRVFLKLSVTSEKVY